MNAPILLSHDDINHAVFNTPEADDMRALQAVQQLTDRQLTIPRYHSADFSHASTVWGKSLQDEFFRRAWHVQGGAIPREVLPFVLSIPVVGHDQVKALPYACFVQLGGRTARGWERDCLPISDDAALLLEVQAAGIAKAKGFGGTMPVYHAKLSAGRYFMSSGEMMHFEARAKEGIKKQLKGTFLELQFPGQQGRVATSHACAIIRGETLPFAWLSDALSHQAAKCTEQFHSHKSEI